MQTGELPARVRKAAARCSPACRPTCCPQFGIHLGIYSGGACGTAGCGLAEVFIQARKSEGQRTGPDASSAQPS